MSGGQGRPLEKVAVEQNSACLEQVSTRGYSKKESCRQRMLGAKAGAQVAGSGKGQGATVAGVKSGSGV